MLDNQVLEIPCQQGVGRSHGTFGELLQGVLPSKRSFMVTFPIRLFSHATFTPDFASQQVVTTPKEKKKCTQMVRLVLDYFQLNSGGRLEVVSEIPEGKGLASSSADLVATAYALKEAFRLALNADLIAALIRRIEPTDGVMYPGSSAFYYKEVELKESFAHLPELTIVAVDEGEAINTVDYNAIPKHFTPTCYRQYERLLTRMTQAIQKRDLEEIGRVSTESAKMNQRHNYKPSLEKVVCVSETVKGLGVVVAHSGTFIGILLDPTSHAFSSQYSQCVNHIKALGKTPHIFNSLTESDSC